MLTIVVPTRNRPIFLKAQLRYFERQSIKYPLILLDASDAEAFSETKSFLADFRSSLSVTHVAAIPVESELVVQRSYRQMVEALRNVETPLVCLLPDDDFYLVDPLAVLAERIGGDPEIALCLGAEILTTSALEGDERGLVFSNHLVLQPKLESRDPVQRVLSHISRPISTWYGINRTEIVRRTLALDYDWSLPSFLIEVMQSALMAAAGKVARIDAVYLVRHAHPLTMTNTGVVKRKDEIPEFDIFDDRFAPTMARFRHSLTIALKAMGMALPQDFEQQLRQVMSYMAVHKLLSRYRLDAVGYDDGGNRIGRIREDALASPIDEATARAISDATRAIAEIYRDDPRIRAKSGA